MFNHMLDTVLDAPSFIQRLATHTGITSIPDLELLTQTGIASGDLHIFTVGEGREARVFVSNKAVKSKRLATVSRLHRGDEAPRRSQSPMGDILGDRISDTFKECADILSQPERYKPNKLIFDTLEKLIKMGHYDPHKDQMVHLLYKELKEHGLDRYGLPVFPDTRTRIYTDSGGIASYQGADADRAICEYAVSKPNGSQEDMDYALRLIEDEYDVTVENYKDILADPVEFVRTSGVSKPLCTLRAAEAVRETIEEGGSAYICQQDTTNSGGLLYAWLTGDRSLAALCNALPSEMKQCLYEAAGVLSEQSNLLPKEILDNWEAFCHPDPRTRRRLLRKLSKKLVVPMIYGANHVSLTLSLLLANPQKDSLDIFDQAGCYIEGSLESLSRDKFKPDMLKWAEDLGFGRAALLLNQLAKVWILAMYGGKNLRGLTTRLRPAMSALKKAGKTANENGVDLQWTNPSDCTCVNWKMMVDQEADPVTININDNEGQRFRISFLPIVKVSSEAAVPPNVIHSVDAAIVHFLVVLAWSMGIYISPIHDSFGSHMCDARMVKKLVKRVIIDHIPQDVLDQVVTSVGNDPLGYEGLSKEDFAKADFFLGISG